MQRKIIQLGKETFVISLPSLWTKHHKLKKGDELEVEEVGPKLVVYALQRERRADLTFIA